MDRKTFYEVWGAKKGTKPDPSTYLPKKYIKNHLTQFDDGVARFNTPAEVAFHKAENGGMVGYKDSYTISGGEIAFNELPKNSEKLGAVDLYDITYNKGLEFVSTKVNVDELTNNIGKFSSATEKANYLNKSLGLPGKFDAGAYRYDIDGGQVKGLNVRMPSGNKPGAWAMDWIPGGKTSGGTLEAVVDAFDINGTGVNCSKLY